MERQYVGARYVPLFAEPLEWDNQRRFERLTIVTYLGSSYTSKKDVPSGILPTNTEYWALTGNYNAQVELYREEVANLNESTNDNTLALTDILITIGDSYGVGFNLGDALIKSWTAFLPEYLGLVNGVNYFTASMGSSGFVNVGDNGKKFVDLLNDVVTNMTDVQKKCNVTIMVCGGHNDRFYEPSVIMEAISNFVRQAKTVFSNCTVLVGMIGSDFNEDITARTQLINNSLTAYNNCGYGGAHYIANSELILCRKSYFIRDLYHPNNLGQQALGLSLASAYKTGCCDVLQYAQGLINSGESESLNETQYPVYTNVRNHIMCFITRDEKTYETTEPITINFTSGFKLGSFECDCVPDNAWELCRIPFSVNVTLSDGSIKGVTNCRLTLLNGEATLQTNWYNGEPVIFENVVSIFMAPVVSQTCADLLLL